MQRRSIQASSLEWVDFKALRSGEALPLVATPAVPEVRLDAWIAAHWASVEARLLEHGAILFRGFDAGSAASLDRFVSAVSPGALPYEERSSPRSVVAGNVYTSTDHPPEYPIFLHNEQSYNLVFPLRIFFACATAAARGGETPIADCRRVLARIDPTVRRRLSERRYMYVRNFGGNLGLSWQAAFQTESRPAVEAYCRRNGIAFEWRDGDRLRTRQVRNVIARHPATGATTWFNHATFFHVSTLPPAIRDGLLASMPIEDLPNHTYYGDGSPIEPEVVEALRAAYEAEMVSFPWAAGDVLLVDNLLTSHGRAPFEGRRLTLAAMSNPTRWDDCRAVGTDA